MPATASRSIQALSYHGPAQRNVLAVETALVGAVHVQGAAVLLLVFFHGQLGTNEFYLDAVARADPLAQGKRLGKLVAGFQVEDADARLDLGQHVDDAIAFRPERGGHGQPGEELLHRPAQDLLGRLAFEGLIGGSDPFGGPGF